MAEEFKPEDNQQNELTPNEFVERQQAFEEILFRLEEAAGKQEKVELTVRSKDGSAKKGTVTPWAFDGGFIWVIAETGEGMQIEMSRIEKVEQKNDLPEILDETKEDK